MKNSSAPAHANSGGVTVNYTFFVAYMVGLSAFGSFVNDMYLPSLPEMTRYFDCSVSMVQMGLTTGMIGLGIGQFLMGPISDKYGRKVVLLWSLLLFCVAAVASVFSHSIHEFLCWRLIQGMGASGGYFLARTIPADVYGGRTLAKTMALIGAINGFAPAMAPVFGGFISDNWTWKAVFWVLAALSIILILCSKRLKETLPPSRRYQGKLRDSFKNYGVLLRNRRFMVHVLLKGSALGVLFAYTSSAPFIIQDHYGYSETVFGLFMGLNAIFVAAGAMVALKFKVLKYAGVVGSFALLAVMCALCPVLWFVHNFWAYELLLMPMIFCLGMIFTTGNTLAMNEGRSDAGTASAILGIMGYIFGAIVAPLVGQGNIMHSTAIVFAVMSVITCVAALMTARIPADLD